MSDDVNFLSCRGDFEDSERKKAFLLCGARPCMYIQFSLCRFPPFVNVPRWLSRDQNPHGGVLMNTGLEARLDTEGGHG